MDFRELVRVIWPGEVSGVVARAVNLSPTGMLIDAPRPTPCPVGSDVLCDVTLPRGPRLLRGRVAHRRLLPTSSIGMGIEFIDLSPREVAELRDVVDVSDEAPQRAQRVKVRFAGTPQIVRARAVPTAEGFRLATTLPFLKTGTEVDIALPLEPGALAGAKGWVASVALEPADGTGGPRLLIDVRVSRAMPTSALDAATPVVEPLFDLASPASRAPLVEELVADFVEAVPEPVWEPDALGATAEPPSLDAAPSLDGRVPTDERVPMRVAPAPTVPMTFSTTAGRAGPAHDAEEIGAAPTQDASDKTEVVVLTPPGGSPWRAMSTGMLAGVVGLAVFVLALLGVRLWMLRAPAGTLAAPPVAAVAAHVPQGLPAAEPPSVPAPVAVAPAPAEVPAPAPPKVAAPLPSEEPAPTAEPAAGPADAPGTFSVGLEGSLADVFRYPLRAPDGVAFNLPHARATLALGTYTPAVRGLRSVWVRALPGGGTHLRFYFGSRRPPPRIELDVDAARVVAH